jgi:hypothetical protein
LATAGGADRLGFFRTQGYGILERVFFVPAGFGESSPMHRVSFPQPAEISGLAAFWSMDERTGQPRRASRGGPRLLEAAGPIETVEGGVFGERILRVRHGQWLETPRAALGDLDIHGPGAELTLAAWFRRDHPEHWQAIAGVWDESRDKRQYCLFANARLRTLDDSLERVPCAERLHAHVSDVGGPTPGKEFCHTYATGATPAAVGVWCQAALVYRAGRVELWRDGRLDVEPGSNPLPAPGGLFDGGADGAVFAIGANSVRGAMGNFFEGLIAGVAVWRRALTVGELAGLAQPLAKLRELHPERAEVLQSFGR